MSLKGSASYLLQGIRAGYPLANMLGSIRANLLPRAAEPEDLEEEAEYAMRVAQGYLDSLEKAGAGAAGSRILELGPGKNLGSGLILACHGVRVTAVEPRCPLWDTEYHPRFYAALRARLADSQPSLPLDPLDRVKEEGRIPQDLVRFGQGRLEDLPSLDSGSFDAVFSNAVLEHVEELGTTVKELARITRPRGLGFHQIDLRFHSCFERPLDFLLYDSAKYSRLLLFTNHDCGSRLRLSQYRELFEAAGFRVVGQEVSRSAEPKYLDSFLKKLRRKMGNPYQDWPREELAILSARLVVKKQE